MLDTESCPNVVDDPYILLSHPSEAVVFIKMVNIVFIYTLYLSFSEQTKDEL